MGRRRSISRPIRRDDDTQPAFSADGERIAFRSERQGGGIFVMGRTGESVRRITDNGYTPLGRRMACGSCLPPTTQTFSIGPQVNSGS